MQPTAEDAPDLFFFIITIYYYHYYYSNTSADRMPAKYLKSSSNPANRQALMLISDREVVYCMFGLCICAYFEVLNCVTLSFAEQRLQFDTWR